MGSVCDLRVKRLTHDPLLSSFRRGEQDLGYNLPIPNPELLRMHFSNGSLSNLSCKTCLLWREFH